ncbi:CDGSH iron-sulfur domain-containing protein [Kytococcus sedentarius]|uniref:CDGSH iron-sulfur domain-containing protein n=1 Tax=Kytococcus sedentarius TaxID=1276 RepID=UPI0019516860|nr:CDGSH iron-sulfur domain-containing protein [Kytococcus sedentarius]QRO86745.1 CDGSH iron-sulfur domain-containing protein [Kytococcus sedentarius]
MSAGEDSPIGLVEALPAESVDVMPCPGGPALLRGATHVIDAAGTTHPVSRPVVAVCRCGASGRLPWCDGTHKLLGSAGDPAGDDVTD